MYRIVDYGAMLADRVRMQAFASALERVVTPDSVVIDLGAGPGVFAMLACQFGARRVYAIEPDDVIQVASEAAEANGYRDRIQIVQALSTDVTLPERADVIVSDIGGALPWFGRHLHAIVDARRRLLKPAGVLIPQQDTAWAAIVDAEEAYLRHTNGWEQERFGLNLESGHRLVANTRTTCRITRDHLLSPPQRWFALDYRTFERVDAEATMTFVVERDGVGHGIAAGFDRTLLDGIRLSNAPDAGEHVGVPQLYAVVLFPWPQPVAVRKGDAVTVTISAQPVGQDYVWSWRTVLHAGGRDETAAQVFSQSTFQGTPLTLSRLRKRADHYTPTLGVEGEVLHFVLEQMRSRLTLSDIAMRLAAAFPARFADAGAAFQYVADVSHRYG